MMYALTYKNTAYTSYATRGIYTVIKTRVCALPIAFVWQTSVRGDDGVSVPRGGRSFSNA